jgi:hypothetical protein
MTSATCGGDFRRPLQGSFLSVILTQGCASGFTLGYCPAPLRGWNTVDI